MHRHKADTTTLFAVRFLAPSPARMRASGCWLSAPTREETRSYSEHKWRLSATGHAECGFCPPIGQYQCREPYGARSVYMREDEIDAISPPLCKCRVSISSFKDCETIHNGHVRRS